jgi:HAD superfamily hydrolase (TIGR01509 family)
MNAPILSSAQWRQIDTVLLDLDGTLLDLAFDSHFWGQQVPAAFARRREITLEQAQAALRPRFAVREGTLDWYCIEFWSRELELDIRALKQELAHGIRWLPGAREFLQRVRALRKRLVLITNAHPATLAIKDERTQVTSFFDAGFSSHVFGAPKEHPRFWSELAKVESFDPARSLFVDDSLSVLRTARAAGIGLIYAVQKPGLPPGRPPGRPLRWPPLGPPGLPPRKAGRSDSSIGGAGSIFGSRAGSTDATGILRPMYSSMSGSEMAYSSQPKLMASPSAPARAVRPIRWT